jgi:CO/xanthine dehydrogenase Mo-binding subunit
VKRAFADAEVIVKQRITSQRLIPTAMETRGVVAEWQPGDKALTVYSVMQILICCVRYWPECWVFRNRLRQSCPKWSAS